MPRQKRTEEEIRRMRERILDATLEVLRQEGPEGMSIRKIADSAGVSHMLPYQYFENRAEIIQSLREREFKQVEAFYAQALRRAEIGEALVQVRAAMKRFVQLSQDYPMLYRLVWRSATSRGVDSQHLSTILEHLTRLIELCIERGQCVERDPALAAVMVFGIVNGTLIMYQSNAVFGKVAQAELEAETVEAAMTYLTATTTPPTKLLHQTETTAEVATERR